MKFLGLLQQITLTGSNECICFRPCFTVGTWDSYRCTGVKFRRSAIWKLRVRLVGLRLGLVLASPFGMLARNQ